jgi:hypothetical protein
MVVLEQHREGSRLVERRPRRPVALAGVLFLMLALLPLVSDGPVTSLRAVTALALGLGASLCFVLGLPRARRLPVPERASAARLELCGNSNIEGYAVAAVAPSGAKTIVLSGADPGRVLADALALSAELGAPVEPGWGLDREALGVLRAPATAPLVAEPLRLEHRVVPDQAIGAGTALWGAAFILGATLVFSLSPARPNVAPTALALVLPVLTSFYALVVGLWLLGLRETLTLEGATLTRARRWFGKPLGTATATPAVVGVFVIAPLGGPSRHLLVATRKGPVGLPTDPRAGTALAGYRGSIEVAGRAAE